MQQARTVYDDLNAMRRTLTLAALLLAPLLAHAQQPLSFEPGGKEACAAALHLSQPTSGDARPFKEACTRRDLELENARFAALSSAMEKTPPEQRVAFNALMVEFTAFRDAHAQHETCVSGSACNSINRQDLAAINNEFLQLAEGKMTVPPATADDLTKADAALNSAYEAVLAAHPATCDGAAHNCVSQAAVRDTERAWIRYRDAWLTFATLRWPQVASESWLTYLSNQRAGALGPVFPWT